MVGLHPANYFQKLFAGAEKNSGGRFVDVARPEEVWGKSGDRHPLVAS